MGKAPVVPLRAVNPLLLVWLTWVSGPACFALCAALNDGEPDCLLACLALCGHGTALLLTGAMSASARFRRIPEYPLLLAYWLPLAGCFVSMTIDSFPMGRWSILTALGCVGLVPVAGAVRLVLMARGAATRR